MPKRNVIRRNDYHDSFELMVTSVQLQDDPGIVQAIFMMGTPSNKQFLRGLGLLSTDGESATPSDLIVAIEADSAETLDRVERDLERLLGERAAADAGPEAPRTLETALRQLPGANLCLISVPGQYAAGEARKALRAGLHVLLFSDNVTLDQERALKEFARSRGLLCMGPDCGVVNLNGVALALASVVRRGPIGIAGASGSGIQQVAVLVERWGLGVSQAIGVGGRDAHDTVGGLGLEAALEALEADPETRVIVVVSRAPGAATLPRILGRIKGCGKPVVACLSGVDRAAIRSVGACAPRDLEEAAAQAVALALGKEPGAPPDALPDTLQGELLARETRGLRPTQRFVRGLFCGGTFLDEALRILTPMLGPIHSNASPVPELMLTGRTASRGHTLVDLGAEEFTLSRPHPVIDPQPRRERLLQEADDPEVAVLLLDFILGPAVHPDPAGAVVDAIIQAKHRAADGGRYLSVVASVCGTEGDPQRLSMQEETLRRAGVVVLPSNAQAAKLAAQIAQRVVGGRSFSLEPESGIHAPVVMLAVAEPARSQASASVVELFTQELRIVNVGLTLFAEALRRQSVKSVSVDWRPPAGGDPELASLLEKLGGA